MSETTNDRKALDIGCGNGSSAGAYDSKSGKWIGIDIDGSHIPEMRTKYPDANFLIADANHLPFKDGSFNTVLASHVWEHVSNPDLAAAEIVRVVEAGGKIDVRVPHPTYENLYRKLGNPTPHKQTFSTDALVRIFNIPNVKREDVKIDKWWAAASILARSLFYRVGGDLFIFDQEIGVWKPKPESHCANFMNTVIEGCLSIFERAARYGDKIGITLFLNRIIPFETRYQGTKE
ncbi:class I SAM-dependent methyltransferase [Candidatus Dojkabacteria bacterium]|nr:class I SAM-dependent methyltransferase [Candidatus Dojkabacteria bacterium]